MFNKLSVLSVSFLLTLKIVNASVFIHPENVEEFRQKNHQEAVSEFQNSCCGIIGRMEGKCWVASGCLIHKDEDSKRFYVLTSAHDMFDEQGNLTKTNNIELCFSSRFDPMARNDNTFRATVFYPYPQFCLNEQGVGVKDIALVEFQTNESNLTLKPIGLYSGEGYKKSNKIAAQVAGFGPFGTNQSFEPTYDQCEMHCGYTNVSFMEWRKHSTFRSWLRATKTEEYFQKDPENIQCFSVNPSDNGGFKSPNGCIIRIQPHKKQTMHAKGGSGSPLVFLGSDGIKRIAGVASQISVEIVAKHLLKNNCPFLTESFEPVMPYQDWINEIVVEHRVPDGTKPIRFN